MATFSPSLQISENIGFIIFFYFTYRHLNYSSWGIIEYAPLMHCLRKAIEGEQLLSISRFLKKLSY